MVAVIAKTATVMIAALLLQLHHLQHLIAAAIQIAAVMATKIAAATHPYHLTRVQAAQVPEVLAVVVIQIQVAEAAVVIVEEVLNLRPQHLAAVVVAPLAAVQILTVAALLTPNLPTQRRHLKQVYLSQQQLLLQIKSSTVLEAQY